MSVRNSCFYESCCDQIIKSHQGDRNRIFDETVQTDIYGRLAELARGLHVTPEYYSSYQKTLRQRTQGKDHQAMPLRQVYAAVARLISRDYCTSFAPIKKRSIFKFNSA
ncbi:hypothetical protein [Candidatus Arsenophonus triatominarum]|uniref:hypothetical protein n=1 Tax=Candidatus Arsenophonus triatominarum TaxID=57911 RepID=UPI0007C5B6DE|nr:hypothetical protein [Candidatus Arsenophonus triatominarum]